jgi:TPR repeat protein
MQLNRFERGEGVAVDQKEAVRLYEQAAKVLEPRAMWNLAGTFPLLFSILMSISC